MKNRYTSRSLVPLLALLTLALAAYPAASFSCGCVGADCPAGPPPCWQGPGPGGLGTCSSCRNAVGSPGDTVSTFSGNLYIQDTPVSYTNVGDRFPFTVAYNTLTSRAGPMGSRWTHSYNTYVLDDSPNGARVVEGDGSAHYFSGNPSQASPCYTSRPGVWDVLQKTYSGSNWTGWKLTRPTQEYLTFGTDGKLTGRTDTQGLSWSFSYTSGNLTTVTDPMGRQTTLTYTNGRLTRVTPPGNSGNVHADFTYDASNRLHTATDAAGYTYTYGYDSNNRVTSLTDPSGREVDYTYDSSGRVSTICTYNLSSSLKTYTYTPQTNGQLYTDLTETKNQANRVTRWIYENTDDPNNGHYYGALLALTRDAGGLNLTQAWAYDSQYRKTKYKDSYTPETGGKAHIAWYYYTDSNNPSLVTKSIDPENVDANPPSQNCPGYLYEYDSRGNMCKVTTPEGRERDYTYYSGTSRLYTATIKDQDVNGNPVDRTTTYTYYGSAKAYQVDTVTDGRGNVTTYDYCLSDPTHGPDGSLKSVQPQEGGATTYTHNDLGDVTSTTDGNGNITSYQYDNIHRVTQVIFPSVGNGQKTRTTSWGCCGKTQETDENGVVTQYLYEDDQRPAVHTHRLWEVVQDSGTGRLNYTTEYTYDEVGNTKTVKNPRLKTTTYVYDDADRKVEADYPDSTSETWDYRDDGRLYQHTDGRGRVIAYRYDADDRLCGPYGSGYVAIDYPSTSDTDVNITRDKDGLITEIRDASGTTTNAYYPSQRVKTAVTAPSGSPKTITYQYNGALLLSSMQVTGENAFSYSYNGRNKLSSATNPNSVQVSFTYDNGGRRTRITDPGSYVEYVYNARNWITEVRNRTTGGTTRYDAAYAYNNGSTWDNCGNPLVRTEDIAGSTYTTTLVYDAAYRETRETKKDAGNNTIYDLQYGYDPCGNRTSRILGGTTVTYVYDDNNKLLSSDDGATYQYDGNGNMTGVTGGPNAPKSMTYNDADFMTEIKYGPNLSITDDYWYAYDGRRYAARFAGGAYRYYLSNGLRVLEELDGNGAMQARYTTEDGSFNRMLLHLYRPSGTLSRFPMYDNIGTVRGLVDASGTVTDTYGLDTFGRSVSSTGTTPNPYRFGGAWGYITDASGMLQLGTRYYWPEVGRFAQQDPVRQTPNRYPFAYGDPTRYADPDGQCGVLCVVVVVVVIVALLVEEMTSAFHHEQPRQHTENRCPPPPPPCPPGAAGPGHGGHGGGPGQGGQGGQGGAGNGPSPGPEEYPQGETPEDADTEGEAL